MNELTRLLSGIFLSLPALAFVLWVLLWVQATMGDAIGALDAAALVRQVPVTTP
jgi:hypothetical protein